MRKIIFYGLGMILLVVTACSKDPEGSVPSSAQPQTLDGKLAVLLNEVSPGEGLSFFKLPDSDDYDNIPQDPNNLLNDDKVALGKLLYHETALALSPEVAETLGSFSCASCHFASAGFQAGRHQGIGEGGTGFGVNGEARDLAEGFNVIHLDVQPIRSPTTLNTAYQIAMLWNGQFGAKGINEGTEASWSPGTPKAVNELGYHGLETQAIAGLSVHRLFSDTSNIEDIPFYKPMYDAAFSEWPVSERYTRETTGLAIAAYERTLLANQSSFQRWLQGEYEAMSDLEKEGALVFFGKAQCVNCHTGPALNSMDFQAIGMQDLFYCEEETFKTPVDAPENLGRGGFTNRAEDMFRFKVPQLYNLKDSPFYGHGASFRDLRSVVEYKNEAVSENPNVPTDRLSEDFIPLGLTEQEITALTAFLENALYDPNLSRYEPNELPSGQCFPNADVQSMSDLGCQ
jgi:cytochrome c peroxidase